VIAADGCLNVAAVAELGPVVAAAVLRLPLLMMMVLRPELLGALLLLLPIV
jgi:hypothetical protein